VQQYVALLRGIAPSGRHMTNDLLRGVVERLGFEGVVSVLSSGNLVFRGADEPVPDLERRLERALAADLGVTSRTLVRTGAEVRALVKSDPFPGLVHGSDTYLTATFLRHPTPQPAIGLEQLDPRSRVVGYDPAARVLLAVIDNTDPRAGSRFVGWVERAYGKDLTMRSWLTVQRVARALQA
jgi:uncharacterized protein (DUF1697 family)